MTPRAGTDFLDHIKRNPRQDMLRAWNGTGIWVTRRESSGRRFEGRWAAPEECTLMVSPVVSGHRRVSDFTAIAVKRKRSAPIATKKKGHTLSPTLKISDNLRELQRLQVTVVLEANIHMEPWKRCRHAWGHLRNQRRKSRPSSARDGITPSQRAILKEFRESQPENNWEFATAGENLIAEHTMGGCG